MYYLLSLILIISPLILLISIGDYLIQKHPALFEKIIKYMEE